MKSLFKRKQKSLAELQATLEFPNETIDFTEKGLWRFGSMEKYRNARLQRASILLAAALVILLMTAISIAFFIYYKSR